MNHISWCAQDVLKSMLKSMLNLSMLFFDVLYANFKNVLSEYAYYVLMSMLKSMLRWAHSNIKIKHAHEHTQLDVLSWAR